MSRIMILGYELPVLAKGAVEARSYRTWQFVQAALADGHEICVLVSHENDESEVEHSLGSRLNYHRINMRRRRWIGRANQIHERFKPDGLAGIMFNNCLRVTRIATDRPIWMDIYGDKMAETQIAEYTVQSSRGHRNLERYMQLVLKHGDVYSTCGTPQKYALVGQLSLAYRLNRYNMGYELVHPILPGATIRPKDEYERSTLRGSMVAEDAFIILWCGGYNVWTDVDCLYKAVDGAMERDPRIVYISVGAAAGGGQNNSYDRFLSMIEKSKHRQRYYMQGWQPANQVPSYYIQADVGISLDAFHYETILGTRTRMSEMMSYGLPVVTSMGCELSEIIEREALGMTFPIGDAANFQQCLLSLAQDEAKRQRLAQRAQAYVAQQLSFATTTRPFLEWAKKPNHAPDRMKGVTKWNVREIEYALRTMLRGILWNVWALERGD